jgi:hypothetical protein
VSIAIINALKIQFNPPGVEGGMQLLIVANFGVVLVAALCVSSLGVIATWLAVAQVAQKNIAELVAGSHR